MRLIVGVTGASGVIMSYDFIKTLKDLYPEIEIHLIISDSAKVTWNSEVAFPVEKLIGLADHSYDNHNMAALVSSGSFITDGMVVLPCSMKTAAGIASGYTDNLINRAADVCIKEGRKVVLVPREMPLSQIHLRNLLMLSKLDLKIIPPMLTFYNDADTVEKQISHITGKIMMQFGLHSDRFKAWEGC